jgi:type II secretory pathway pseudopilin PulG
MDLKTYMYGQFIELTKMNIISDYHVKYNSKIEWKINDFFITKDNYLTYLLGKTDLIYIINIGIEKQIQKQKKLKERQLYIYTYLKQIDEYYLQNVKYDLQNIKEIGIDLNLNKKKKRKRNNCDYLLENNNKKKKTKNITSKEIINYINNKKLIKDEQITYKIKVKLLTKTITYILNNNKNLTLISIEKIICIMNIFDINIPNLYKLTNYSKYKLGDLGDLNNFNELGKLKSNFNIFKINHIKLKWTETQIMQNFLNDNKLPLLENDNKYPSFEELLQKSSRNYEGPIIIEDSEKHNDPIIIEYSKGHEEPKEPIIIEDSKEHNDPIIIEYSKGHEEPKEPRDPKEPKEPRDPIYLKDKDILNIYTKFKSFKRFRSY